MIFSLPLINRGRELDKNGGWRQNEIFSLKTLQDILTEMVIGFHLRDIKSYPS